jgi:hypothetical protein
LNRIQLASSDDRESGVIYGSQSMTAGHDAARRLASFAPISDPSVGRHPAPRAFESRERRDASTCACAPLPRSGGDRGGGALYLESWRRLSTSKADAKGDADDDSVADRGAPVNGAAVRRRAPASIGGYEIRRVLGRGAMGIVYEAFDPRDGALVALKTIVAAPREKAENLYRLKQEFRAVADLQHPNIIRFGELSSHEGEWFFTMELLRGVSFLEHVRADFDGTGARPWCFDDARLRGALAQLVSALAAVHERGLVHRDVKPSNVIVTDEGRVVVLDFGLIASRQVESDAPEGPSGTPDFMAPEQIDGSRVGPSADWYAVGSMLFAALTGRKPFEGETMEVMAAKLTKSAPRPSSVARDVPADLDALCNDLLRTNADERPTVDAIRARLGLGGGDAAPGAPPDSGQAFVGRQGELASMRDALDAVARGAARTVVIEGEAGIGKSALAQRFLRSAGARTLVLFGRCYEQESVPFKGVDSIVDALSEHLRQLPEDEVPPLVAGGVRFLAAVFPVLNRVPSIAEATSNARTIDNPMALREQAIGELERLLAALSRRRTVVLVLDDLQWADPDSVELLHRALHASSPPPCLFLATMRAGAPLASGASALLDGATRIALGGLSPTESKALCDELREEHGDGRSRDDGHDDDVMQEAAGHPLYLAELVRAARRGEQRRGARRLTDVLWERIEERDPLERRFLEMLAIAGAPTPYEVIARAAALDVGACHTRLGALRAAQLVRITPHGAERLVLPYHDHVRETIEAHRDDPRAVERDHLHLGRALFEATPPDARRGARIFAIVHHMNLGRALLVTRAERVRLAELNLLATSEAILATAYGAAKSHAAVALDLLGEDGWRDAYGLARDLQAARMRAEFLGGNIERARECFDAARVRVLARDDRTDLYVAWVELQSNRGAFEDAIASARERLDELGVWFPQHVTSLSVLLQYVATRWAQRGRTAEALRTLAPSTDPKRASAMKVLMAMTPAAYWISSDLAGWISLKLAQMSMRHGVSEASSYGFATYGVILEGAFGKLGEAAEFGRLAIVMNDRYRNHALAARIQLINGEFLAPWVVPFADAKKHLDASYDVALKHGETMYEGYAACSLSHLSTLGLTDVAATKKVSEWARDVCARRKDWNMVGSVMSHLRFCDALLGTSPAPLEKTLLCDDLAIDPEFRDVAGDPSKTPSANDAYWEFRGWVAYLFGKIELAAKCIAETHRFAQAHFGHLTTHDLCFLDCLVSAKAHDRASWAKRIALRLRVAWKVRQLGAWAKACPANFEAHWLIARAELARMRGRSAEAERLFDEAARSAQTHGAPLREALAWELAADLASSHGEPAKSAQLSARAADVYRRCGAVAKADALVRARSAD